MLPTQLEEDGSRSSKAAEDEEMKVVFSKNRDENGLFSRNAAFGAAHEMMMRWKHLSAEQANVFLSRTFDPSYNDFDVLGNGRIAEDEMYKLISQVYKS